MPISFTVGLIGPGKLRLSVRDQSNPVGQQVGAGLLQSNSTLFGNLNGILGTSGQGPELRKVGPGKLRLPPRDYGQPQIIFTQATAGLVRQAGPGVGPNRYSQFVTSPRSTAVPGVFVNIAGSIPINSTIYGSVTQRVLVVGMVPQPGPGIAPFNNNTFTMFDFDTSKPSATNTTLAGGYLQSNSTMYGTLTAIGALSSLSLPQSQFVGQMTAIQAGALNGIMQSDSSFYGQLVGIGQLGGVMISNSLLELLQVGSGFRPFVPNTPVLDVRTDSGYEPWTVRPGKTIG